MAKEEEFVPYLVFVRFDKGDRGVVARIEQSAPALQDALREMGEVQFVEMSYDGSVVVYLVAADSRFRSTMQVLTHLQSPRSGKGSALVLHDKVLVIEVGWAGAHRLERVTSWLRDYGLHI